MSLRATRLTIVRGGKTLVREMSLTVEPGQALAIVGPSGTGKTSLLRVLVGLDTASSGTVEFGGTAPPSRSIGYVPQHAGRVLPAWLDVERALRFRTQLGSGHGMHDRLDVLAELRRFDLPAQLDLRAPVRTLSGGQAQLVAWLSTWLAQPRLLVLDEAFAGMDEALRATLTRALRARLEESTSALVLATHDLAEVAAVGARTIVLGEASATSETDFTVRSPPP